MREVLECLADSTPALRHTTRFRTQPTLHCSVYIGNKKSTPVRACFFSSHLLDLTTTKAAPPHR
ncbi:hypothetical protein VDS18_10100 [Xanthomonas campestris pv. campestris]|nr:hypothetical protein [Xanthomonas campestris pv. campestris]